MGVYILVTVVALTAYAHVVPFPVLLSMMRNCQWEIPEKEDSSSPEVFEVTSRVRWIDLPEVDNAHYSFVDPRDRAEAIRKVLQLVATIPASAHYTVVVPEGQEGPVCILVEGADSTALPQVVQVNVSWGQIRQPANFVAGK